MDDFQRAGTSASFEEISVEESDDLAGTLVELSEETTAFLEAVFSTKLSNADRKKRIAQIGIPDSDMIHCPKLDPMLATVLPKDAIKADGYLSRLQQFWLEQAYSPAQAALYLMGNANNHMAQERRKRILLNVNPTLKSMMEENAFQKAAPMLFGEEFAKKATDRVEALKAIKKISCPKSGEKHQGHFFRYHLQNQQDGCGGGFRSGRGRFQPYQKSTA